ncbi:MAG: hypothetical protein AVDCRST_MAG73-933 [uncultured Thermomicrobiales bacterium]|uniref:DUF983 domain-containing protein n=1 Tax=uncultured Thermomicrobiales bacterium TaxID=1645740 RepID=A0A6J4TS83_9BACT|nr:MAG: hypothetical protein AVDCRST_MAG73-933 [uncultured Thermomicrobiales bacterium]
MSEQRRPVKPSHAADLPVERRRPRVLFGRALLRRCPHCGAKGIFTNWMALQERCPRCGLQFEREEGYFLGAYAINLIVAEFLGFGIVVLLLIRGDLSVLQMQILAVVLAVGLPFLFFPYSRTLWMAIDLIVHPPRGDRRPNAR